MRCITSQNTLELSSGAHSKQVILHHSRHYTGSKDRVIYMRYSVVITLTCCLGTLIDAELDKLLILSLFCHHTWDCNENNADIVPWRAQHSEGISMLMIGDSLNRLTLEDLKDLAVMEGWHYDTVHYDRHRVVIRLPNLEAVSFYKIVSFSNLYNWSAWKRTGLE